MAGVRHAALRRLHDATASFAVTPDAVWPDWFGRDLGGPTRVIGHCDTGPWNILASTDRQRLVQLMIDLAVADAADQARDVTPDAGDTGVLWALTWCTRSAAWMVRHRRVLAHALR